jgi:hypothetical protein
MSLSPPATRSPYRHPLFLGASIGLFYGILARALANSTPAIPFFAVMTVAFLVFIPLALGFLTVRQHPLPSWLYRVFAPWLPISAMLFFCWAVGWEGSICVVMAFPILLVFSSIGGILGGWRMLRRRGVTVATALLPLAIGPFENGLPSRAQIHRLETTIPIHASPAAVWSQVVEVPTIRAEETRPALFTTLGFPRPLDATLSHRGVGGVRYARFEHGVLFIETITHWTDERRLRFTIDPQTDSIPPTTLDRHVTIGGPYFDVLSGEYTLEPRPDGTVLLHLASELSVTTHFNVYARPWVDGIMRSIQRNILDVVKARAEGAATRAAKAS